MKVRSSAHHQLVKFLAVRITNLLKFLAYVQHKRGVCVMLGPCHHS